MEPLTERFQKEVFRPYVQMLQAQYRFHPVFEKARTTWANMLSKEELLKGPYLDQALSYASGAPLESLQLGTETIATIADKLGGRSLYKHQTDALRLLLAHKNAVVATGTSSGKTLCYQIPILDDLITDPSPGLRAIIVYPLNALVNDQLNEWEDILRKYPKILFARFTGQTPDSQRVYEDRLRVLSRERLADKNLTQEELQREIQREVAQVLSAGVPNQLNHRDAIRTTPPHILITNFSMLEYLLERPIDAPIFNQARLQFIVLDEVHSYRGVQSTEIAFLIRRLKDRIKPERLTCIATSATLGKQGDSESAVKVRSFVSSLFGEPFEEPNPVYGTPAEPFLKTPSYSPSPRNYLAAADILRIDSSADVRKALGMSAAEKDLATIFQHDKNLFELRNAILLRPTLLSEAATRLWPSSL